MKSRSSGFTLIELMIVVAIIGILAAIAVPKFAELIRKSHEGSTKGNLGALRSALSIYYGDTEGTYPSDNLASLTANGKYIAAIPTARVPSYHAASSVVCVGDYTGGSCRIGFGAPPGYDVQVAGGIWVYWDTNTPPQSGTLRVKGDLWLGCLHTDTKGNVWTTY